MVKLSETTIKFLEDDIISILYDKAPISMFTYDIAKELRRDKQFTKKILLGLSKKELVETVKKNKNGIEYKKRMKWRIPSRVLKAFENQMI